MVGAIAWAGAACGGGGDDSAPSGGGADDTRGDRGATDAGGGGNPTSIAGDSGSPAKPPSTGVDAGANCAPGSPDQVGCACSQVGTTRDCSPGSVSAGACPQKGTQTCQGSSEFSTWSPCTAVKSAPDCSNKACWGCVPGTVISCDEEGSVVCSTSGTKECKPDGTWGACTESSTPAACSPWDGKGGQDCCYSIGGQLQGSCAAVDPCDCACGSDGCQECVPGTVISCDEEGSVVCSTSGTKECKPDGTWGACTESSTPAACSPWDGKGGQDCCYSIGGRLMGKCPTCHPVARGGAGADAGAGAPSGSNGTR